MPLAQSKIALFKEGGNTKFEQSTEQLSKNKDIFMKNYFGHGERHQYELSKALR